MSKKDQWKVYVDNPMNRKLGRVGQHIRNRKCLGNGGAKRHKKVLRSNIRRSTKPVIRRLARRGRKGGVNRIPGLNYEETRRVKEFLENIIRDAVTYAEHAKRKTVTAKDVVYALRKQGRSIYGFGG